MNKKIIILNFVFGIIGALSLVLYFLVFFIMFNDSGNVTLFSLDPISILIWSILILVPISIILSHIVNSPKIAIFFSLLPVLCIIFGILIFVIGRFYEINYDRKVLDARNAIVASVTKDFFCHGSKISQQEEGSFLTIDNDLHAIISLRVNSSMQNMSNLVGKIDGDNLHVYESWNTEETYKTCVNNDGKNISQAFKIIKDKKLDLDLQDAIGKKYDIDIPYNNPLYQ